MLLTVARTPMTQSLANRPLVVALYANAAVLLLILLTLWSRAGGVLPAASAAPMSPQPITGGGSLYVMPAQLLNNVWGCYVLDVENQTLCTYSYNGSQLRLIAARNIRFDHQLGNYNTHPDPDEIRRLVEIERDKIRGLDRPAAPGTLKPTE